MGHWETVVRLHDSLQAQAPGALRPHYTWSLLHAGNVARTLDIERISVLEVGVAGGSGLVALEAAARHVQEHLGVGIDVIGLDAGDGMPPPRDHRDAPYLIAEGDFPMDERRLRDRLDSARLLIGPVAETAGGLLRSAPAPIGFVAFDLDYYSSTVEALALLEADPELLMPRVLCYFDDVLGYPWGESNGARLAISEWGGTPAGRTLDRIPGLRWMVPRSEFDARWTEAMYLAHVVDHPRYADPEGTAFSNRLDLE